MITGQPPEVGILDYDLAYFDDSDLSWEAEDRIIQLGNKIFAGLPAPVQIRNQARVHLWYPRKFGTACPPHASTEAAIDTFEATNASVGVHQAPTASGMSTPRTAYPRPRRSAGRTSGRT